jgi:hypothetical protein
MRDAVSAIEVVCPAVEGPLSTKMRSGLFCGMTVAVPSCGLMIDPLPIF